MNTNENYMYEDDRCDTVAYDHEAYTAGYNAGSGVSTRFLTLNTVRMLYRLGYSSEKIAEVCTEFDPALVADALEQVDGENGDFAMIHVEYYDFTGQYSYEKRYGIYRGVITNTCPPLIFQGTSAETAEEDFKLTADIFARLGGHPDEDICFKVEPTDETEWMASIGLANDIRHKNIADAVMDAKVLVLRGASPDQAAEAVADTLAEDESRITGREEMACAVIASMFETGLSVALISKVLKAPQETVCRVLSEAGFDDEEGSN